MVLPLGSTAGCWIPHAQSVVDYDARSEIRTRSLPLGILHPAAISFIRRRRGLGQRWRRPDLRYLSALNLHSPGSKVPCCAAPHGPCTAPLSEVSPDLLTNGFVSY
uniref:Uncharacterized protein n=1 Tax=Arundo donax TaxID=35708 RepID=A0A0A9FUH3_ARUDO